jgi:hypothetical protein
MIRTCVYPNDADEVLKIGCLRGSQRILWCDTMKYLAIFSVKSAYKLALEIDQSDKR